MKFWVDLDNAEPKKGKEEKGKRNKEMMGNAAQQTDVPNSERKPPETHKPEKDANQSKSIKEDPKILEDSKRKGPKSTDNKSTLRSKGTEKELVKESGSTEKPKDKKTSTFPTKVIDQKEVPKQPNVKQVAPEKGIVPKQTGKVAKQSEGAIAIQQAKNEQSLAKAPFQPNSTMPTKLNDQKEVPKQPNNNSTLPTKVIDQKEVPKQPNNTRSRPTPSVQPIDTTPAKSVDEKGLGKSQKQTKSQIVPSVQPNVMAPSNKVITDEDLRKKGLAAVSDPNFGPTAGQMKVIVRLRPLNGTEAEMRANQTPSLQVNDDSKSLQVYNTDDKITVMGFNRVYSDSTPQDALFQESGVKGLVLQAMTGYATTIFAFGQTGSGKTFTITGPAEISPDPQTVGIVPRALSYMFEEIEKQRANGVFSDIRVQASYLEIYNENVLDLLNPQNSGLPVRWSQERGFFVENLLIVDCDSLDDCLAVLEEGLRNRTTGEHSLNEHSSRSHSVLTIYLEIQGYSQSEDTQHRYGKISFVDLAGSEKVKETKSSLYTFNETLSINKSLLTLGKCISALADPRTRSGHIPFRDSKLTKLLADSLGGKGSALMIACVSPSFNNLQETLKTLRYAMQARKIQNRPMIQLDPQEELVIGFKTEIQMLKKEIHRLRELLERDGKYWDELREISEEMETQSRRYKSRASSPTIQKLRSKSSRRETITLPDIKNKINAAAATTTRSSRKNSTGQVVSLPRVSITAGNRNTLPSRLTDPKRKSSKSASRQRIDEMRKSAAPAGQEDKMSKSRSQTPFPSKEKAALKKRPSASESSPYITKEPFPEPRNQVKSPDVAQVVNNRHQTLNEVEALDKEIEKLGKPKKKGFFSL